MGPWLFDQIICIARIHVFFHGVQLQESLCNTIHSLSQAFRGMNCWLNIRHTEFFQEFGRFFRLLFCSNSLHCFTPISLEWCVREKQNNMYTILGHLFIMISHNDPLFFPMVLAKLRLDWPRTPEISMSMLTLSTTPEICDSSIMLAFARVLQQVFSWKICEVSKKHLSKNMFRLRILKHICCWFHFF